VRLGEVCDIPDKGFQAPDLTYVSPYNVQVAVPGLSTEGSEVIGELFVALVSSCHASHGMHVLSLLNWHR
jgi:hypothetical protein